MLASVAMQLSSWHWYVEDAAISFSYAQNLVAGEGLVAYPGGERVEGYSNPLWVLLIAVGSLAGIEAFAFARFLGCLLGALTVPVVWKIAEHLQRESGIGGEGFALPLAVGGNGFTLPLTASLALVANVQFAIWNGSGLENSLVCLLLALGIWRTLLEAADSSPSFPWSALCFLGLALTRPEGILYAAIGGGAALLFSLQDGRSLRAVASWLLVFFVPFVVYHAARYQYFAWPLPNTYYAKLGGLGLAIFDWDGTGWSYLRDYAGLSASQHLGPGLGQAYLLPVYVAGALVGVPKLPRFLWWSFALIGFLLLLPPPSSFGFGAELNPGLLLVLVGFEQGAWWWLAVRAASVLLGLALVAAVAAFGGASRTTGLCWAIGSAAVVFAVASHGDWMKGYRWLSVAAVPASLLFAAGLAVLTKRFGRDARRRRALVAALMLLFAVPQLRHLIWFADNSELSPAVVKLRVDFWERTRETLQLEDYLLLDVDMGATLYWSDGPVIDLAGLVDVPVAQYHYKARFLRDYIFKERRPDFAHVHMGWATLTELPRHPQWREHYVKIPGYGRLARPHGGNHVRRDLLFEPLPAAPGPRSVMPAEGLGLVDFSLPAQPTTAGAALPLDLSLTWAGGDRERTDVLAPLHVALADDSGIVFEAPILPGYGWVDPSRWRAGEAFHGHYSLEVPEDLPAGRYHLGFSISGEDAGGSEPELSWFDDAVEVVSAEAFAARNASDWQAVLVALSEGDCERGEELFRILRQRMRRDPSWEVAVVAEARSARARCWVGAALKAGDPARQVELLARARRYDHRSPELADASRALADRLYAEALETRQRAQALHRESDVESPSRSQLVEEIRAWRRTFQLFNDTVRADPSRSWARRYAEEARAHKLGFHSGTAVWRLRASSDRRPGQDPAAHVGDGA